VIANSLSIAELVVSGAGSIDTRTDIQQANGFLLAQESVACDGCRWWLQSTRVAASAVMRSVLKQSSEKRLSTARNSCWVVVFALIVYQTCNGVKRALSLAPRTEKNSLWLMSADARPAIFSF